MFSSHVSWKLTETQNYLLCVAKTIESYGSMFPPNCNLSIPLSILQQLYQNLIQDLDVLPPPHHDDVFRCSGKDTNGTKLKDSILSLGHKDLYALQALEHCRDLAYVTCSHKWKIRFRKKTCKGETLSIGKMTWEWKRFF